MWSLKLRALNKIRVKAMNQADNGSHQWRALKHFWKLILTPAGLLKYDNYWSRRNFGYTQLTDVEVIQHLAFNDDLKAYRYYQDLILAINHRSKDELNHLLAIKWTQLPQSLQKVQRTLRRHRKEIITSFKYGIHTRMVQSKELTIRSKLLKRTAYGFRNFFNFRARIFLPFLTHTLPSTGRIKEQLGKISISDTSCLKSYSSFLSVLLDEEP